MYRCLSKDHFTRLENGAYVLAPKRTYYCSGESGMIITVLLCLPTWLCVCRAPPIDKGVTLCSPSLPPVLFALPPTESFSSVEVLQVRVCPPSVRYPAVLIIHANVISCRYELVRSNKSHIVNLHNTSKVDCTCSTGSNLDTKLFQSVRFRMKVHQIYSVLLLGVHFHFVKPHYCSGSTFLDQCQRMPMRILAPVR